MPNARHSGLDSVSLTGVKAPDPANRVLAVFSKNPVEGKVKTRLASAIGNARALEIYEALRRLTALAISPVQAQRVIWYTDFVPQTDTLLGPGTEARLQRGSDLGERMQNTFCEIFSSGPRHAVLIGTDCPGISADIIEKAFALLESCDSVLGPAMDGGFYLIGLKQSLPELFLGRTWSTSTVLEETIEKLETAGFSFSLLPELRDIDTFEDLQQSPLRIEISNPSPDQAP
ncbi:MAG: glycosyltransferase [Chlorobiaceae bacterium]|nr:glycosyltransferase [Chlorobiaceae bacterium]